MKKINLITSDNQKISANLFALEDPKGWLLLSHMMPANKESWNEFAEAMQQNGYESLAIDLRGHGESDGGPEGFRNFDEREHQSSIQDLAAGWEFLKSRGATPDKTILVGASIGANLSLQFLTMQPDISGGILLSPGDYKGIDSALFIQKLNSKQRLLLVASKKDERVAGNNADQNRQYYDLAPVQNKQIIIFDSAGHGTDFFKFKEELNLSEAIESFLNE